MFTCSNEKCKFEMSGPPESGICPMCGTVVDAAKAKSASEAASLSGAAPGKKSPGRPRKDGTPAQARVDGKKTEKKAAQDSPLVDLDPEMLDLLANVPFMLVEAGALIFIEKRPLYNSAFHLAALKFGRIGVKNLQIPWYIGYAGFGLMAAATAQWVPVDMKQEIKNIAEQRAKLTAQMQAMAEKEVTPKPASQNGAAVDSANEGAQINVVEFPAKS